MKKISVIAALLLCSISLFAVPARPGKTRYVQPDGSVIEIVKHGDEWGHWTTNAAGKVVKMDADGFYREVEGVSARDAAQAASIRRAARRRLHRQAPRAESGHVAIGKKNFLVVLVEFEDKSFTVSNPQSAFSNMLNQEGYTSNGATGSARDYYFDNSHGVFEPVFDVYGPVKLDKNASYYGENDAQGYDMHAEEAVADACKKLDSSIDFSKYDLDGDGKVDLVYMVYAGKGEADGGSDDTIWPHQFQLSYAGINLILDEKTVDRYACGSELDRSGVMEGIGTMCHEFGHAMGLPDFYDTDYDANGEAGALYDFSLMCGGSYNNNGHTPPYLNIIERIMLGWLDETAFQEFPKSGSYSLKSVHNDMAYISQTDMDGEFFMYECRSNEGWDQGIGAYGLLVYHVDQSSRNVSIIYGYDTIQIPASQLWSRWDDYNSINENGSHPCFYIVAAPDQSNLMFGYEYLEDHNAWYFDPYGDNGALQRIPFPGDDKITTYRPKSWNGVESAISFSNIALNGNVVTFDVSGVVTAGLDYPYIANPGKGVYTAGSDFALDVVTPDGDNPSEVSWKMDGEPVGGTSVNLSAGSHKIEAAVTMDGGKTYVVTLELQAQ
ncbi:MAG: M6 family metalloprotease domain-containing protein [Bacteroidales bacterium]|nr:M6 family metalloprotease domain-containing protein [Bacteroidales bacterium]